MKSLQVTKQNKQIFKQMENNILIAAHIITAIMFGVTLTNAIEKRKYIRPFTEILIFISTGLGIVMLVRELIMMNYDLTWVFPQWYIVRLLLCVVIMILINRVIVLKKENERLKNQKDEK